MLQIRSHGVDSPWRLALLSLVLAGWGAREEAKVLAKEKVSHGGRSTPGTYSDGGNCWGGGVHGWA